MDTIRSMYADYLERAHSALDREEGIAYERLRRRRAYEGAECAERVIHSE